MKLKYPILILGAMAAFGSSASAFTHITADISVNTKWTTAGSPYILEGIIYVKSGAILDVEPGTIIRGQPRTSISTFDPGALVIRPDSKIQARGTPAAPIIFTTAAQSNGAGSFRDVLPVGSPDGIPDRWVPGDADGNYYDATPATAPLPPLNPLTSAKNANMWGGLVIAGDSLTNNGGQVDVTGDSVPDDGFGIIEGLSGPLAIYGGFNSEHNGGILKYVSIRHGGAELVANRELNGLTLYAVGSKTTISYIDVYATGDDGVEIFGGTVNLDHLNINYADDDGLDIDEGYQGTIQYVFILQGRGYGDSGMELDGEDKVEGHGSSPIFPVGDARIYNATVLSNTDDDAPGALGGGNAARMRAGFAGSIVNSIFKNFAATAFGQGLRVDSTVVGETENSARTHFNTGLLQLRNNTVHNYATLYTGHGPDTGTISITTSGVVSGSFAGDPIPGVYYPATNNRTLDTGIPAPSHTTFAGVDPRPSLAASALAYGSPQDSSYVPAPAVATLHKGAFDRTATTLWTYSWTALNKTGVLKD